MGPVLDFVGVDLACYGNHGLFIPLLSAQD